MRRRYATRADAVIMVVLAVLALAGLVIPFAGTGEGTTGSGVAVRAPGGEYALEFGDGTHREIVIEGSEGTLTLALSGASARVVASDCPDQLCVRMGHIERRGERIACLPLGVLITVAGGEEAEYDAITR